MKRKHVLNTIKNLLSQAHLFIYEGSFEDVIQLVNSASLLFEVYDDKSVEFNIELDNMHTIKDLIIENSIIAFERELIKNSICSRKKGRI